MEFLGVWVFSSFPLKISLVNLKPIMIASLMWLGSLFLMFILRYKRHARK